MADFTSILKYGERAALLMQQRYRASGYSRYRMGKFEEYDLYAANKDFLVSDNVITFTDSDGRLMALKPDVTLSIVRNYRETDGTSKVYYSENVYRRDRDTHSFREIMQVGLECIGQIDAYAQGEVVYLACESLALISENYVLNLSHMGLIRHVLEQTGASVAVQRQLLTYISEKNRHGVEAAARENRFDPSGVLTLIGTYGEPEHVLQVLRAQGEGWQAAADELAAVCEQLRGIGLEKHVHIDFSVINDMKYYNGIVFQGFVDGVPQGVLSGGRYDNLLSRMKKNAGAIGFAVYLDALQRLQQAPAQNDFDVLLLYRPQDDPVGVARRAQQLRDTGKSVLAATQAPPHLTFGETAMAERGKGSGEE